MRKFVSLLLTMLLTVNLVGCGNNTEQAKETKEEPKTETVTEKVIEEVIKEEFALFSEMESLDELTSTLVTKLANKDVKLTEADRIDDGYATTITYYIEFEHDVDSDGFDWNQDSDFYIDITVDNKTLEPYEIYADCMMVSQNQSTEMKAITETILEIFAVNDDAVAKLNEQWNPHRDMEFEVDLGDGATGTGYLSLYTDAEYGVQDLTFGSY